VEGEPQHTGCFPADLEAGVALMLGGVRQGGSSRLRPWQVVGHAEGRQYLVTAGLVHGSQDDVVQVDIGADTQGETVL